MFFIDKWYHLWGFAVLGFDIYVGILFMLGDFTKKDPDFFWIHLVLGRY